MRNSVGNRWVALAIPASSGMAGIASGQKLITHDGVEIGVHPLGLLASLPREGLRTFDGPAVELHDGFAEWLGLAYQCSGQKYSGIAEGVECDWAGREPMKLVSFKATRDRTESVARLHDALITTTFSFDPDGPYLIVGVEISNTGRRELRNVMLTREWRCSGKGGWSFPVDLPRSIAPPKDIARDVWMLDDLPPGGRGGVTLSFITTIKNPSSLLPSDVPLVQWTSPSYPLA